MVVSRRSMLQISVLSLLGLPFSKVFSSLNQLPASNLILGGGQYKLNNESENRYVFSIVDADLGKTSFIKLDFLPHGIHINPINKNILAVYEKKGPHACEIDLQKRKVVRYIPTDAKRMFYGHGIYSVDGAKLYSTETYQETHSGVITIRDSHSMKYMGEFPSYGSNPHECKLIDNGNVLIVTNAGGGGELDVPCVCYIDINSKKLLKKVALTNSKLNVGHIAVAKNGGLMVVSAPHSDLSQHSLGGVSIQRPGEDMLSMINPEEITQKMAGEALSVVIHEGSQVAAVTHPDGGMVTFWSMKNRTLLKVIHFPHPRGVTLTKDNSAFLVSYDQVPKLVKVNATSLTKEKNSIIPDTYITGSHLYNWSRELTEIMALGPLA